MLPSTKEDQTGGEVEIHPLSLIKEEILTHVYFILFLLL
jgi:hypothetical protein